MSKPEPYKWAKCPLSGCGEDLCVETTSVVYVDDRPQTDFTSTEPSYWEVTCANGHVLDCGGSDSDGRNVILGYRSAQSLGGLR